MAPLSKLTLTKFERSQTHQDPVLERRAKALNALAQQRDVLNAALEGREHTVTVRQAGHGMTSMVTDSAYRERHTL